VKARPDPSPRSGQRCALHDSLRNGAGLVDAPAAAARSAAAGARLTALASPSADASHAARLVATARAAFARAERGNLERRGRLGPPG